MFPLKSFGFLNLLLEDFKQIRLDFRFFLISVKREFPYRVKPKFRKVIGIIEFEIFLFREKG
jgi:hypothetical protein